MSMFAEAGALFICVRVRSSPLEIIETCERAADNAFASLRTANCLLNLVEAAVFGDVCSEFYPPSTCGLKLSHGCNY